MRKREQNIYSLNYKYIIHSLNIKESRLSQMSYVRSDKIISINVVNGFK